MASRKAVTQENLVRLGADRLASLLCALAGEDATLKRRLRLELLSASDPAAAASEVGKRLATIARSRSVVEGPRFNDMVRDLTLQRDAIAERIAPVDPTAALHLMWRFMSLAETIYQRCDAGNGSLDEVFGTALEQLGPIAAAAKPDPVELADRVLAALQESDSVQYSGLVSVLAPTLGPQGLEHLKRRVSDWAAIPPETPPKGQRRMVGFGTGGPIYADELQAKRRDITCRTTLADIADIQGDPDAFIAQYTPTERRTAAIATAIADRLLTAGRAPEALAALDGVATTRPNAAKPPALMRPMDLAWELKRVETLEALDRGDDAQTFRWHCFEATLAPDHLREYVQRLPDFDDLEAEERGLDLATRFQPFDMALDFLIEWPALDHAAAMVIRRQAEVDGDAYYILTPAAAALAGPHPLAATVLLRSMIDFSLTKARSSRYRHAARHLEQCIHLSDHIKDWGSLEPHPCYVKRLRSAHGRKVGFWRWVDDEDDAGAG